MKENEANCVCYAIFKTAICFSYSSVILRRYMTFSYSFASVSQQIHVDIIYDATAVGIYLIILCFDSNMF